MDRKCSPFWRQLYVVTGVLVNISEYGFVNTFISVLLPQLRSSKYIDLDMDQESWIVSISSIANIVGMLIVPKIMDQYGRRFVNLINACLMCILWFAINIVTNYQWMLVIRFFQGLSLGMILVVSPVLLGEYPSPKYRGAFLSIYPLSIGVGVLFMHSLGSFMTWRTISIVCGVISFVNAVMIFLSPESPSFLAYRGRYEECRTAFHWLRGVKEDEELEMMIKANMSRRPKEMFSILKIQRQLTYALEAIRKKEVFKPFILMCHLLMLSEWSASNIIDVYTMDVFEKVVDKSMNLSAVIISTDFQRLVTNFIAIFVIRYVRRRVMVLIAISSNITVFLMIAAYVYTRNHGILPFDHPIVGVLLMHLHTFTMAIGNSPLPLVILGEVFPLQYRSVCNMWANFFYILNVIINMKTVLPLFTAIGLEGAYCVYAAIVGYSLIVTMIILPETKDRSLQEIEEEFRGAQLIPIAESNVLINRENIAC